MPKTPKSYQEIRPRQGGIIRLAHHPRVGDLPEYWGWNYEPHPDERTGPLFHGSAKTRAAALKAARKAARKAAKEAGARRSTNAPWSLSATVTG